MRKLVLTFCILNLALIGYSQTNRVGNYYSWQHPEWPPIPGTVQSGLRVYTLNQTNLPPNSFLVDDRGVVYQTGADIKKRLSPYNLEVLLRHPDLIRSMIATDDFKLMNKELTLEETHSIRIHRADYKLMLEMSKTNVHSPFSLNEELVMLGAIRIGEQIKTNRLKVIQGLNEAGLTLKISENEIPLHEYRAHLAKQALFSQERSATENFLSLPVLNLNR